MERRVFSTGVVDLSYEESPAVGLPTVLLHGVARRGRDFEPILPALGPRCHLYALDFRGHGHSGRTPGSYRVIDYVGDVVAFLERRVARPAALIGHSLGGMVAAAVASACPDLVQGLVLEDPPFEMMGHRITETSYPGLFRAYLERTSATDSDESLAAALAEVPVAAPGQNHPVRLGDLRDPASLRSLASSLRQLDPEVLAPVIEGRWLDGFDPALILPGVKCPGLLLQADDSAGGLLPDDYASELVALMPQVRHVLMAGVGHNIHAAEPEQMARLTTDFLDSLGH